LMQAARPIPSRGAVPEQHLTDAGETAHFPSLIQRARQLRDLLAAQGSSGPPAEGITVFSGQARFISKDRLEADGREIQFRRAILAGHQRRGSSGLSDAREPPRTGRASRPAGCPRQRAGGVSLGTDCGAFGE
jgi:hypothetical protein